MTRIVRFGNGQKFHIAGTLRNAYSIEDSPRRVPIDSLSSTVSAALETPLEFPPLAAAIVPGDRIALAIAPNVPHAMDVAAGVIDALLRSGTALEAISIVVPTGSLADMATKMVDELPTEDVGAFEVVQHDPASDDNLSFLGASKDTKPVYLNRTLCNADMVVPIGCFQPQESVGYLGLFRGLFPVFGDEKTQRRFCSPSIVKSSDHAARLRKEADEAAWLLGTMFSLQVVPGLGNTVAAVLAGNPPDVQRLGSLCCRELWKYQLAESADLVVATIDGGPLDQTWQNLAFALLAAANAAREDGTIVLCTDIDCRPGPALRLLAAGEDEHVAREIQRARSDDAIAASVILEMRQQRKLYLVSQLRSDTVEELGMGYVAGEQELERLIGQHTSSVLLPDAHRAVVEVETSDG